MTRETQTTIFALILFIFANSAIAADIDGVYIHKCLTGQLPEKECDKKLNECFNEGHCKKENLIHTWPACVNDEQKIIICNEGAIKFKSDDSQSALNGQCVCY